MRRLALPRGCRHVVGRLPPPQRQALVEAAEGLLAIAPLRRPMAPWGKPLSVSMSNAGRLGWVTDAAGYRYQSTQPLVEDPWPPIPELLMDIWRAEAGADQPPDCCLINHYPAGARLGLHRDDTEAEHDHPVLSISIGDAATFRIGGNKRADPTRSLTLECGDMFLLAGEGRMAYHGVDRIKRRAPNILDVRPLFDALTGDGGGRLSFTLRVAGSTRR